VIKPSLYYLFDKYLDKDIGSEYDKLKKINIILNINDFFNLQQDKIYDFKNPTHATLFYHIKHNEKYYLYYSNSGLGITNHININNHVIPKIYCVKQDMGEQIINLINRLYVCIVYEIHQYIIRNQTISKSEIYKYINEYIKEGRTKYTNLELPKFKLNEDCEFLFDIHDTTEKLQNIIYALINFVINRINDDSIIYECTFNHIINGDDPNFDLKKN